MDYLKEKEFIIGMMGIDMKVNGKMVKRKEKEFIILIKNPVKVIDMKVIIEMIKEKEKEFIIIIMVKDMKVIGEMIKWKEKELCILMVAIE